MKNLIWIIIFAIFTTQLPVNACATCGCSEMCLVISPMVMIDSNPENFKNTAVLTDSIWGNTILKMAYQRDVELQALAKKLHISNVSTTTAIGGAAGASTLAQSIVSLATLNPPPSMDGMMMDSYAPGTVGLGVGGTVILAFGAKMLWNHKYNKNMNARKMIIKQQVEAVLQHLEFSRSACPEAQKELTALIGEHAAGECIQLWQFSHTDSVAAALGLNRPL